MDLEDVIKKVTKDYDLTDIEFKKKSALEFLLKKKSEIESDILNILDKNKVSTIQELDVIVETDREHPEWEELISLENLYERLKEIENDIKTLS